MTKTSVGAVETKYFTFATPPEEFILESKERLSPVVLAYETYGTLNPDKSNAILILHALSGDAHAAGYYKDEEKPGWWDNMIGPGRAFDTEKYFVICSNILGGCRGSTGPSSINPKTNKPYALDFPVISIGDMVAAQKALIDYLGIDKLLTVVGGSMGGMQALAWLVKYSDRIRSAIPIACALKHSPQQIAFDEVGRQAIMADPDWKSGNYYGGKPPDKGLAVARMLGHITYMSDISMAEKFGRQKKNNIQPFKFTADFEVEGYLHYRGDNFVKRFDANSYLYITKAMDNFDASKDKPLHEVLSGKPLKVLVIAFKSDWLYPVYQSKEIVKVCKHAGIGASFCEVDSTYGHDAFLLETEEETHLISHFLKSVSQKRGKT
ncbi:MAG: homoserine O-acetyltransferase [Candidatus Omnitrophica bacterium]|jgi:homoserine O-acetyltransferase|nr:homoserine O-acetyltransferase [Candidatus Omnitrophota bacterium]